MNTTLTQQEKELFEPTAKILAANGVAQSVSYTFERKYLNGVTANSSPMHLELLSRRLDLPSAPYWIKLFQVGKPLVNSAEKCFTAIQKILSACFLPNKIQLIFLIHSKNGIYEMYLGLRSLDKEEIDATFVDSLTLCRFITGADFVIIKQIIFANLCWRQVWHNYVSSGENSLFPSGRRNRTESGCCRKEDFWQHKTNQSQQIKCQFQRSGRFIRKLCVVVRDKRTNPNHMRIQFL